MNESTEYVFNCLKEAFESLPPNSVLAKLIGKILCIWDLRVREGLDLNMLTLAIIFT